jgi:hypothetical protein
MAPRRILLIDAAGPCRDALARVLSCEGYQVRVEGVVGRADRVNEITPDFVVYREGLAAGPAPPGDARWIALTKPVNMEELRRVLRES